jgi:hypothetical protein
VLTHHPGMTMAAALFLMDCRVIPDQVGAGARQ